MCGSWRHSSRDREDISGGAFFNFRSVTELGGACCGREVALGWARWIKRCIESMETESVDLESNGWRITIFNKA
jgi:hypothetical protein